MVRGQAWARIPNRRQAIGRFESPTRAEGGTPGLPYPSAQVRGTEEAVRGLKAICSQVSK